MNAERLLVLAAFLETVPPHRWDFSSIVGANWQGKTDLSCGTTACALGWATQIPELNEAGMRLPDFQEAWEDRVLGLSFLFRDAERVFDISGNDSDYLFNPADDEDVAVDTGQLMPRASAREVAAHIRSFVRGGGRPYAQAARLRELHDGAMLAKARVLLDVEGEVRWADLVSPMNSDRDTATVRRLTDRLALVFDDGDGNPRLLVVSP